MSYYPPAIKFPFYDAYNVCDAALRPMRPLRSVNAQDIDAVDEPLRLWEESTETSHKTLGPYSNFVYEMLDLLNYVSLLPDISGADAGRLRLRAAALIRKIHKDLLQDCREEEAQALTRGRLRGDQNITEYADRNLLSKWSTAIEQHVLTPGCHAENRWEYETFPRLLMNLETFTNTVSLPIAILDQSGILRTLKQLIVAPTVPASIFKPGTRNRAKLILCMLVDQAEALTLLKDVDVEADREPHSALSFWKEGDVPHDLRRWEIERTLAKLGASASAGDTEVVMHALQDIERWGPPSNPTIKAALIESLHETTKALQNVTKPVNVTEAADRTSRLIDDLYANDVSSKVRTLVEKSYYTAKKGEGGTKSEPQTVVFKDIDSISQSGIMSSKAYPEVRPWDPITITLPVLRSSNLPLSEPVDALFEAFMKYANEIYRHPLDPLYDFDFTNDQQFLLVFNQGAARETKIWRYWTGGFMQGLVSDFVGEDVDNSRKGVVVWYKRRYGHKFSVSEEAQEVKRPAYKRRLPSSCYPPPTHWIDPTPPSSASGARWNQIPTLSFVGNGSDIHPHTSYPPIISKHIFIPSDIKALGLRQWTGMTRRQSVPADAAPLKFTPPLSLAQAQSLLGRTVLYELPDSSVQAGGRARTRDRQARKTAGSGAPSTSNDNVYCAFVWGLDPQRMIITLFETDDTRRTFWIGSDEPKDVIGVPLPTDYPPLRKVARPNWLGPVEIAPVTIAPPTIPSEPVARKTRHPMQTRWAEILKAAPMTFEVGVGGDNVILVGELMIQNPEQVMHIDNCKSGIWESGYRHATEEGISFSIWVQWTREGSVDFAQPSSSFVHSSKEIRPLRNDLSWREIGAVGVDGGSLTILAQGYLSSTSRAHLMGDLNVWNFRDEEEALDTFIEMTVLSGWEAGRIHIPGGICNHTGGDGGFSVWASDDQDGRVIAVKVEVAAGSDFE